MTKPQPDSSYPTRRRAAGEGTVFRHPKGWRTDVWVTDETGEKRRKTIVRKRRQDVIDERDKLLQREKAGLPTPRRELTLGQYLEDWITGTLAEQVATDVISQKTAADYANNARLQIIPDLGHYGLRSELGAPHIRTWLAAKRRETSSRGKPFSPRAVQYYFATLRRALADAFRDGLVDRNVALLVQVGKVEGRKGNPLTPEAARAVVRR
jgi:hypothetical protein